MPADSEKLPQVRPQKFWNTKELLTNTKFHSYKKSK